MVEAWENPDARVDNLVLMASRPEVEAGDISGARRSLEKLLQPENAKRLKGRLIFGIQGYEDDPRDLWEISDVREWVRRLDEEFPYWFYFMDLGPNSTMHFIAFSLCEYEKVPGGKLIPPAELQRFLMEGFKAMNIVCEMVGESPGERDARSRQIAEFFLPELKNRELDPNK